MTPPRVLVCGSRHWTDREAIRRRLAAYPPGTVIIHGGCRGADGLAFSVARELGFAVEVFPADWTQGPRAGPERNARMLAEGRPTEALAFAPDLSASRGTADMVRRLKAAGVPGRLVTK